MNYRLRNTDDGLLVLQVYNEPKTGPYNYETEGIWRDAKVTDVPIFDLFKAPEPDKCNQTTSRWSGNPSFGGVKLYDQRAVAGGYG